MTLDPNLAPSERSAHPMPIPPAALEFDPERGLYVEVESPACGELLIVKGRTFTCDQLPGHRYSHRCVLKRTGPPFEGVSWCGPPYNCAEPCSNVALQLRVLDEGED